MICKDDLFLTQHGSGWNYLIMLYIIYRFLGLKSNINDESFEILNFHVIEQLGAIIQ